MYDGDEIQVLEHVVVAVTTTTDGIRGFMEMSLLSPSGTTSQLLSQRPNDRVLGGYDDWPFMSVHFWGESPHGEWLFTFRYPNDLTFASLSNVTVTMYGVHEIPESVSRIPSECDPVCKRGCAAAGPEFCDACRGARNAKTLECINECPSGYVRRNNYCYNASLPEPLCTRNISGNFGSKERCGPCFIVILYVHSTTR